MKKYFYIGIVVILMMALALVGYGAWLNYSDEDQIARRMDSRVLQLEGARAEMRELQPSLTLDAVRFSSESMTDTTIIFPIFGRMCRKMIYAAEHPHRREALMNIEERSRIVRLRARRAFAIHPTMIRARAAFLVPAPSTPATAMARI